MANPILLTVTKLSGQLVKELETSPTSLVQEVKKQLEEATMTPLRFQELLLGSEVLCDGATLAEAGIASDSTVSFVRKQVGDFPLHDLMRHICGVSLAPIPSSCIRVGRHLLSLDQQRALQLQELWGESHGSEDLAVLIRFLLDCNVDPNQRDWTNLTPLQLAAREGRSDFVEVLLAQPEFRGDSRLLGRALHTGLNAAHYPLPICHCQCILALAQQLETDVNIVDEDGDTALMIALRRGVNEVWNTILERQDVQIGLQNRLGRTALHEAALKNLPKACELILAKPGAKHILRCKDISNRAARELAQSRQCHEASEVLKGALEPAAATPDVAGYAWPSSHEMIWAAQQQAWSMSTESWQNGSTQWHAQGDPMLVWPQLWTPNDWRQ